MRKKRKGEIRMQKRLSSIPAPALAGVIREKTKKAAVAQAKNCLYAGADMMDLHLSCLDCTEAEYLAPIIRASEVPVLALNYNLTYENEKLGLTEEERVASMLRAIEAGAAGMDLQGYTFHAPSKEGFCGENTYSFTKGNPKEIVTDESIISKQCEVIERVHHMGAEVLLSCHPGIPMTTRQVVDLALFLEKRNPDIIKIVTKALCEEDGEEAIRTMLALKKEVKTPVSYHASGKHGKRTRILNPLLGGQIAFCVERYDEGSTMEQIPLATMRAICDNYKRVIRR